MQLGTESSTPWIICVSRHGRALPPDSECLSFSEFPLLGKENWWRRGTPFSSAWGLPRSTPRSTWPGTAAVTSQVLSVADVDETSLWQEEQKWVSVQEQKKSEEILSKTGRKKEGLSRSEELLLSKERKAHEEKRLSLQQVLPREKEGGQRSGSEDRTQKEGRIGKSSLGIILQKEEEQLEALAMAAVALKEESQEMVTTEEQPAGSQAESPAVQVVSPISKDLEGSAVEKAATELKPPGDEALEVLSEQPLSTESGVKETQGGKSPSKSQTASITSAEEEESAVTSALPGMVFEKKSQLFEMHPLVSILLTRICVLVYSMRFGV